MNFVRLVLSCLCHSLFTTMSERCQTQSLKQNNNQNLIVAFATTGVLLALLLFYRFHFLAICSTYILGCIACYLTIQSNILQIYLDKLPQRIFRKPSLTPDSDEGITKGCVSCGAADCSRHDARHNPEPWIGLRVHKQLDQAIEDDAEGSFSLPMPIMGAGPKPHVFRQFYNAILEQFVSAWYARVSPRPFFTDRLRRELRHASAVLLRRAEKVDYSRFLTRRAIPCALRHLAAGRGARPHPALASRAAELDYLRAVTGAVMPHLLRKEELDSEIYCEFVRELFAGWVLLSLTDVLADPYIINTLIIQATGDETMADLPATPSYHVEFLETFVRHSDAAYARRTKMLRIDLDQVLEDQEYFYAFMQHAKATSNIHLLQFYKDIKSFQTKLLNPELTPAEEEQLTSEAWALHDTYLAPGASRVPLDGGVAAGVRSTLEAGVTRLRQSQDMYQAARTARAALDSVMLPSLLHSEEFYKLFFGPRIPAGYQKQMNKRPQHHAASALKPLARAGDASDADSEADAGLLQYLRAAAEQTRDLSTYKVVFTDVEVVAPAQRAPMRVFTIAVHASRGGGASLWRVRRAEPELHLLRDKLREFHGERRLPARPLPARRDNSPLETLRYKYEDFIQCLLQTPLFQTSELLHLFLTVEGDFSLAVQASMAGNNTDIANIYHSVAHRLRKEKGQHLEGFLRNFLVTCDMERYQAAIKQGAVHVDEALEVNEDLDIEVHAQKRAARSITGGVFGNNLNVKRVDFDCAPPANQGLEGFTECFMFILLRLVKAPSAVVRVAGGALGLVKTRLDHLVDARLARALRALLGARRLAHLIRLGHAQLFTKTGPRGDPARQAAAARAGLLRAAPGLAAPLLAALDALQEPVGNKQLVYNLLDLSILELFPELSTQKEAAS